MAKKQKRIIGAIVKIDLESGYHSYARILDKASYAFYDIYVKEDLNIEDILKRPILYTLAAYDDIIKNGLWKVVSKKIPIENYLKEQPMQFIQDKLNPESFELYNPNTGEITPTKKKKCKGLEEAAVWEEWEIKERLQDHFTGKPDKTLLEYIKIFG